MAEEWRKHLEFVQAVIARQAGNSALVKGWSIPVATAVYGYAASKDKWAVALVGAAAMLAFWWLDAFYLRQERMYRCLYKAVVTAGFGPAPAHPPTPALPDLYSMDATPYKKAEGNTWPSVLLSWPLLVFFGLLAAAGIALALFTGPGQPEGPGKKDCRTSSASASSSTAGVC